MSCGWAILYTYVTDKSTACGIKTGWQSNPKFCGN